MKSLRKRHSLLVLSEACFLILIYLLVVGCSTTPAYEGAFSSNQQVKGNTESISCPMDPTWGSVLEVLAQQGFLIQQADTKTRIILAHREIRDTEDKDLSYTVTATLTLFPSAEQITRVMVAANQTTEMHRKEYRWWKLLWLIPLIPTGTDYTTVVVNRDTVHSPQFYQDFFGAVKKSCDDRKAPPKPVSGS
jgi:hypothetical protein